MKAEQIVENFSKLLDYIDQYITGDRKKSLLKLYQQYEEKILTAPASGREHYHSAYAGGYLVHVLNVVECALELDVLWKKMGGDPSSHTTEELVFSAINHDLGKLGFDEGDQFIPNESEWHRKNLGLIYKNNPAIAFMPVQHRSLFLLQQHGVTVGVNEYIAIMSHDGLYEEGNKPYLITFEPTAKLRTHLPYLLHHADMMACRIEYEKWLKEKTEIDLPKNGASMVPNKISDIFKKQ